MCGTCTILLAGNPISARLMFAVQVADVQITTIEGLESTDGLHSVQQSFIEQAAFQCAYFTPGFILSTVALRADNPSPDDESIREYLAGNLCRCGSYNNILMAVRACINQVEG